MQYQMSKLKGVKRPAALSQLNMLKGKRLTSHVSRIAAILLFAIVAGCAGPKKEVKQRFFWPPLPDQPKIEWVAAYMDETDLPKTASQLFMEQVIGVRKSIQFNRPWGIASDGEGRVFVANTNAAEVVIFDFNANKATTLDAGDLFKFPTGVALDGKKNLYVSDSYNNKVYAFDKEGKPLIAIGDAKVLGRPVGMAINNKLGRLYVVNSQLHNIAVFDLSGNHLFSIGTRGEKGGEFNFPSDIDIDSKENLVVSDTMNARVQILDKDGKFISEFGHRGDALTDFQLIKGVAVDKEDNIFVTDTKADRFLIFNQKGDPLLVIGSAWSVAKSKKVNPGGFFMPQDIAIDKNNAVYIVDSMNYRFQVFQIVDDEWLKKNPIEK